MRFLRFLWGWWGVPGGVVPNVPGRVCVRDTFAARLSVSDASATVALTDRATGRLTISAGPRSCA